MAEETGKASGMEKFDGTDFGFRRMQIEDYLYRKKLHLLLLGKKLDTMKDDEWTLLGRLILGVIRLTLSRSIAHNDFLERKLYYRILYFFLRMVKSLQLRKRKQIVEPRKYCLVWLFSLTYIFSLFLYLTDLKISFKFPTIPLCHTNTTLKYAKPHPKRRLIYSSFGR